MHQLNVPPQNEPARSILILDGVEPAFGDEEIEIRPHLTVGRITPALIEDLQRRGLRDAESLLDGLTVFVTNVGSFATNDLLAPHAFYKSLVLATEIRARAVVHIIAEEGGRRTISGTRLPTDERAVPWGHYENRLTREHLQSAERLYGAVSEVQITEHYHRVGNALLFYMNGYDSGNPDLALVSFTTTLESLFSTTEQEISFRLALRAAHFLGDSNEARREIYSGCRKVYSVRSKIVHGAPIRRSAEQAAIYLVEGVLPQAEHLARAALKKVFELALHSAFDSASKIEAIFDDLLFSDGLAATLQRVNR